MPFIVEYPQVNGHRFSHSSLEIKWGGIPVLGVKSLDYSDELTPGELRGTAPQIIGRTRGIQKATASIELFRLEWEILRARMGIGGVGYGETAQDIQVIMFEFGAQPVMDTIYAPRVMKVALTSSSDSGDGLTVKLDLHPLRILMGTTENSIAATRNIGI